MNTTDRLAAGLRMVIPAGGDEWRETVAHAEDCDYWLDRPCNCEPVRIRVRLEE